MPELLVPHSEKLAVRAEDFQSAFPGQGGSRYSQSHGICIDEMSKMLAVTSGLRQEQVKGQELLTCFNLGQ